jgi:cyclopropane fatty-acyl-phospholipid synthase-like methyltransferase
MTKWIEDWFGSTYYCLLYKHRDDDEAKLFLDNIIKFLKIQPDSRILDCGCGKGRHSFYLNKKGFEVTGLDISESNILESKKREKENLSFFTHDMRNLFRINYYDVALSLFTSFGYFNEDPENNKMIRSISAALKKGGWFVLDFMNVEKETQKLCTEETTTIGKIDIKITRSTKNNCITKEILITDQGRNHSFRENVKVYKQKDLELFFAQNNLEVVQAFGNYELEPFNKTTSERLILIGKKK